MDSETITNEQVLKRLGWRVEESVEIEGYPYLLRAPNDSNASGYEWFKSEQEAWKSEALPDYINTIDLALTLTIDEAFLRIERIDPINGVTEWEVTFDHPEYTHTVYGEILSQAICIAWYQLTEVLYHHEE